jgi:transcription antitermination factor NusG
LRLVSFDGFIDRDFDAYLESKWESNVFNRERLEVKQKLQALGRLLNPALLASDGSLLECEVSAEHPAVWNQRRVQNQYLFFSRNPSARREIDTIISRQRSIAALIEDPSPLRNHIFLSVMIDKVQLQLGLKLHSDAAVDRENLQRKSQEFFQREKLLAPLRALPDGYAIGIAGRDAIPAPRLDDEKLLRLIQELPGANSWLEVCRAWSRQDEVVRGPSFVDVAKVELARLLPILGYIAWSRDNDFVSMKDTLKKKEIEQRSKGLAKNDHVRVVRGIFSGKTGVVQEIDAKGGIRVLLGTVVVKLTGGDVTKA